MDNVVSYSDVTLEICNVLNNYKRQILNDMVIGDLKIVEGVNLIQEFFCRINFSSFSKLLIDELDRLISEYCKEVESNYRVLNNYFRYGMDMAYYISTNYIKSRLNKNVLDKKNNDVF